MHKLTEREGTSAIRAAIDAAGGPATVAKQLEVSAQAAYAWRQGRRRLPESKAALLEALCRRRVTRRQMFPTTWHLIWPEMVTKRHPAPITAAQA